MDISDHYSQFCIIKSLKVKELPQKTMYRKFSSDTEENIHSELSEINWDLAMRDCGDNAYAGFSRTGQQQALLPNWKRKVKIYNIIY